MVYFLEDFDLVIDFKNTKRTTSSKTISHFLDAQFGRHGLPNGLRTDNGSNLVSKEVENYLTEMVIEHRYTTPL